MVYTTLDEVNTSAGIHTLFTYSLDVVPILLPLLLFAFFTIMCLGSYFAQIRIRGSGDFPASFAISGIFVAIIAQLMAIIPNTINLGTLSICYAIAIVGILWVFFSRDDISA